MAKNKISEWSATAANNTDIGGIDIAEGCAPSGINNAIRELMAQVKDQQTGTDADNFTVGGNLTVTGTSTFTGAINAGVIGATALTTTGNTILGDASTDTLNVGNGGLVKDASGNVGIGTTSPAYKLQIGTTGTGGFIFDADNGVIANPFGAGGAINLRAQASSIAGGGDIFLGGSTRGDAQINSIVFSTSDAEKMRLDPNGQLLIGTKTLGYSNSNSTTLENLYIVKNHVTGVPSGTFYIAFAYAGGGIGTITQNGTTGVLYNTTSDYRLKNDVTPIKDALSTITALNPVSFTWIDGRKDDGFLAHEIQEVLPNCVTGEKDAVNEDGTPKYQQMDNSGVVPFLVKAIQELTARLEILENK